MPKSAQAYDNIRQALAELQSRLEWRLLTREDSENYILAPVIIEKPTDGQNLPSTAYLIEILGQEEFERRIQSAIEDIPALVKCIREGKPGN